MLAEFARKLAID